MKAPTAATAWTAYDARNEAIPCTLSLKSYVVSRGGTK